MLKGLRKKNWTLSEIYYSVHKYMKINMHEIADLPLNFFQILALDGCTHFRHQGAPVFIMMTLVFRFFFFIL